MTPMFNGRRPFIFFIESLKERDTSRFNIKVFEDHMQAHCLIPSKWWFYYKMWGTYTIEKYVEYHMHRNKVDMEKRIQKFKELGIAFYTKKRLKKMDDSLSR